MAAGISRGTPGSAEYSRVNPGAVSEKRVVEKLECDTDIFSKPLPTYTI